ncbi:MAG TPA: C4-type zinc ribbon domain-containing protein [Terriglobia bacterium]|nr:C4-type zinc ribbon domain-containing protein [Terriglobia bacterium]
MDAELKTLIDLQQIDQTLSQLRNTIEASPVQVQTLRTQLDQFISATEEQKTRQAANQKERRQLEADIQEIRAKIAKHKEQLYQVKTNEQYRAMLREIEVEEGNIRKIEDRILEKMVEGEQIDQTIREATARLESEKKRVEAEVIQLESDRREADRQRDEGEVRRKILVETLNKAIYAQYEKLLRARNGVALAQVRDGFCAGCHVRLRPQAYNDVRTKDGLLTCETCSRILYYVEPPAEQASTEGLESSRHAAV